MKNSNLAFLALSALTCAASSQASVTNMVGSWSGAGQVTSLSGENQGTYALQMVDTLQNDGSVASSVTIAIPGSANKEVDFVIKDTGKGFSMTGQSSSQSGGATCLEKGLCEGYYGDSSGNGVAITFIIDNENHFRLLKTELQNYQATRLFLEKYVRVQTTR